MARKEVQAIKPSDIMDNLDTIIDPAVIQAVNEILKEKFRGDSVTILQKEIVSRAIKINPKLTSDILYKNHHLDFEPIFRKAGWSVRYDKPGYNESYEATFEFRSNKK
jgi:hypothetical protein